MSMFNRLKGPVVRDSNQIKMCFEEMYDGILISDELRKALLVDDSDNYNLFDNSDRDEFLFRLFKHICLGGELCQVETDLQVYLDFTRALYRDLVSVVKASDTKQLRLISQVYEVKIRDGKDLIFPSTMEHTNTFAYAIVDPMKRTLTFLWHEFGIGLL
ncbi:hypothetical protein Ciccas_008310 [Cichlidogyrus casuarinus]|uniref:Cilia- and flagella-associated protein 300 n=1 Tax=Cichlidogyrus casuarinus TaxID=1844966 RepID=A0ABD2Q0C1_9PLAT